MATSKKKSTSARNRKPSSNIKEQIKDIYFKDLPNDLQKTLMEVHKMIVAQCQTTWKNNLYDDIRESDWAKSMYDEFLTMPAGKNNVGSVRIYKKKNRYSCMIQITGHVPNNREDLEHEYFHEFIRSVHQTLRPKIRRKFDLALTCESEHGEHFEGMDVWTKQKFAKMLWEKFADTKVITKAEYKDAEVTESVEPENSEPTIHTFDINALPSGLQAKISDLNQKITMLMKQLIIEDEAYQDLNNDPSIQALIMDIGGRTSAGSDIGHTEVKEDNGVYHGSIMITPEINLAAYKSHQESLTALLKTIISQLKDSIRDSDTKDLKFMGSQFILIMEPEYAKMLVNGADDSSPAVESVWLLDPDVYHMMYAYEEATGDSVYYLGNSMMMTFADEPNGYIESVNDFITEAKGLKAVKKALKSTSKYAAAKITKELFDAMPESVIFDPFIESDNATPEYNVDMSPAEAKRTLATLSASIINNMEKDPKYFINQYTADIYSNVITKNLLPIWAHGYQKFHIQLADRQSFFTVEFKVPKMTQDFVARYIEGRETIEGLLHRTPEIKVKISPRVFQSMKDPDDAFNFFRALIKYYDTGIARYANKFHAEIAKMSKELKYLVSTTRLSGLVAIPFQMLVVFNDVHMDDKDTFKITASDVNTINQFIRNIYSNYPAPAKNRKQIIDDLNTVVRHLNENCEFRENLDMVRNVIRGFNEMEDGEYNDAVSHHMMLWMAEQVDEHATYQSANGEFNYLQEKFGVKKLKKIPRDLVAYITIEAESIQDANDKMMIASYCLGKLEIVEWYIELIDTANPKYIVPHPRPYLVSLRTQLLDCYKKIMDTKIPNPANRPIIKVEYPAGLEG